MGTFRWANGDTFEGEWKHGLMHGKGIYLYADGRRFHGNWDSGRKNGFGKAQNFFSKFYKKLIFVIFKRNIHMACRGCLHGQFQKR